MLLSAREDLGLQSSLQVIRLPALCLVQDACSLVLLHLLSSPHTLWESLWVIAFLLIIFFLSVGLP